MFMRLRSNKTDAVQRLWLHYCNVMAARGVVRKTSEGPKDFTQRVAKRFPGLRERVVRIGELYIDLRYGKADAPSEQSTPRMRELRTHIRALYLAASPAGKTS